MTIKLLREGAVRDITGISRVSLFETRKRGLFVNPVPITGRSVGYPDNEVEAMVKARIAGKSDAEIRALVESLHAARRNLA